MSILHTNIDLKLRNILHGPMHYKIGVACLFNGHIFFTLSLRCNNDSLIHLYQSSTGGVMNSQVSGVPMQKLGFSTLLGSGIFFRV